MNGTEMDWDLTRDESIWINPLARVEGPLPLLVLLRVRNEELILADTLDHLASFADVICVYEDASTDATRNILRSHPKVGMVIQNDAWQSGTDNRLLSETRHRGLLLQEARKRWDFRWCMCCDADERYVGALREWVTAPVEGKPDAIRIQLFDAYMTPGDCAPYRTGIPLLDFRRAFGPERRDILMLWQNSSGAHYAGLDAREPIVPGVTEVRFYCQHYGKSLSEAHWEDTCDYYVAHFPWEPYGVKWAARKGKSVHALSDFGRPLFSWGDDLFGNAVTKF